jgi:hypothetical protein
VVAAMTFKPGDICKFRDSVWVVVGPSTAVPPGTRWHLRREVPNAHPAAIHDAGEGDMELLVRPSISSDATVMHAGHRYTVLAVLEDVLHIALPPEARREPVSAGPFEGVTHAALGAGETTVQFSDLVLQNLGHFLKQGEQNG